MNKFKTVDDAAQFINAQKTIAYKRTMFIFIKENYDEKFTSALRQKLKKDKQ